MTEFNRMQQLKRRLFAMRNGIVADTLRKAGSPYRIIFGLNVPQLNEIAQDFGPDAALAAELRRNTSTRESQMLAPMLLDPSGITKEEAMDMACEVADTEAADIFTHRLLQRIDGGRELTPLLLASEKPIMRYMGLRMTLADIASDPAGALSAARAELDKGERTTAMLARMIESEARWLLTN